MANYSTNEFKAGLKILIDGDPYAIVENEMVKPGKGQAFNRVRVRNLKTGRTIDAHGNPATRWKRPTSSIRICSICTATAIFPLHGARYLRAAHRLQTSGGEGANG